MRAIYGFHWIDPFASPMMGLPPAWRVKRNPSASQLVLGKKGIPT